MESYRPTEELKYSLWKVIDTYGDTEGASGLRFNKMIALLNHRLLDEKDLDIELPRCWYLFGEATVPNQLPGEVKWIGLDDEEVDTAVKWSEERPDVRSSKNRRKIDSVIDSLHSLFPPEEDVEKAIEEDYRRYAPYEFQRAYKTFRHDTRMDTMIDRDGRLRSEAFYAQEIKKAMKSFPYDDFPTLKVEARKIELLLSGLFQEYPEKNEKGIEMAKDFWNIFCKFLRIKKNEYVIDDRVAYWKEVANEELKTYRSKLKRDIEDLRGLGLSVTDDPMVDTFLSPENLGSTDMSERVDEIVYG